jgi:hypothetical protein
VGSGTLDVGRRTRKKLIGTSEIEKRKMKRILLVTVGLVCFAGVQAAFAYTLIWDRWDYYSRVWNEDNEVETYNRDAIKYPDPIEDNDNFGKAKAGKFRLRSEAYATSDGLGSIYSISLFYARLRITDGEPGETVPLDITAHLRGILRGRGDFNSRVDAGILAYDYNVGIEELVNAIKEDEEPPEPLWAREWAEALEENGRQEIDN